MKTVYWAEDIKLDAKRITEYEHDTHGPITVFHDVVLASEMVQPYEDGKAFKSRDELEAYTWTIDGRWVIVGGHPMDGIISERDQVSGRTVNPRYVIDLLDPKTGRPCRAGVRSDIEIFNDKVPKNTLEDMKNGKKQDVSIGFFYGKDDTPGVVEDGPFKGAEYDYVQRNMFHDHTAAAIDNGRCPAPYCGLTADEINKQVTGDPFAGFPDWDACIAHMTKPKDEGGEGYTKEQAEGVCGMLKAEHEGDIVEENILTQFKDKVRELLEDEYEAFKGEYLASKEAKEGDWWRKLDWTKQNHLEVYNILPDDTKNLITEAGLCPTCGDETEGEPPSECVCPECGHVVKNTEGKHCPDLECPECGAAMRKREPGSGGGRGEGGPDEDENLPYEDGEALDYILTPVGKKPVEENEEDELEADQLDPFEVLRRANEILG